MKYIFLWYWCLYILYGATVLYSRYTYISKITCILVNKKAGFYPTNTTFIRANKTVQGALIMQNYFTVIMVECKQRKYVGSKIHCDLFFIY